MGARALSQLKSKRINHKPAVAHTVAADNSHLYCISFNHSSTELLLRHQRRHQHQVRPSPPTPRWHPPNSPHMLLSVLTLTRVLDRPPTPTPMKQATGRMQGTSKYLRWSPEDLGRGWGEIRGKRKKAKNKKTDFFFSSTLKWTPLVYTFTFI